MATSKPILLISKNILPFIHLIYNPKLLSIDGVVSLLVIALRGYNLIRVYYFIIFRVQFFLVLYHYKSFLPYSTSIVFAVYQLCPNSFGISPLTTIHPRLLLQSQVQPICLIMASSLGFGSNIFNSRLTPCSIY